MKKKVIVGIGILFIVIAAVLLKLLPYQVGDYLFDIFILFMMLIAGMEIYNLKVNTNKTPNKIMTFCYPIFYYLLVIIMNRFHMPIYFCIAIETLGLVVYVLFTILVSFLQHEDKPFKVAGDTLEACVYPGFLLGLMIMINHLDLLSGMPHFSFIFIVLIFTITMMTDTAAMLIGTLLRGPKLAPQISPNKTFSGAIGGLIGGVFGAAAVYGVFCAIPAFAAVFDIYEIKVYTFIILGVLASVIGQAGDLFESFLKRKAGVKDASNFFPGHGGMLDRIDALTFVVCFMAIYLMVLLV